jgi:hypothetical protein
VTINEWKKRREEIRKSIADAQEELREHYNKRPTVKTDVLNMIVNLKSGTVSQVSKSLREKYGKDYYVGTVGKNLCHLVEDGKVERVGFLKNEIVYQALKS